MSVMSLDEARRVLFAGTRSYSEYVAAGAVVYENHMRQAHPGQRLTFDTKPRPYLRDQPMPLPGSPDVTTGGTAPGGKVGARLVTRLAGPVSSYFISLDPQSGQAALYQTVDADDAMDPGKLTGDIRAQARVIRMQDRARQRGQLRAINEHNRKLWGT